MSHFFCKFRQQFKQKTRCLSVALKSGNQLKSYASQQTPDFLSVKQVTTCIFSDYWYIISYRAVIATPAAIGHLKKRRERSYETYGIEYADES